MNDFISSLPSLFRPPRGQNLALSEFPGEVRPGDYAFPWPDALPDLGPRHVGPFDLCARCGSGTWVRYGTAPRCLHCALAKTEP